MDNPLTSSFKSIRETAKTYHIIFKVCDQWMEIQRVNNKVHTTGYTKEQQGQIRLCQKTSKWVCTVLKNFFGQMTPRLRKSMEKEKIIKISRMPRYLSNTVAVVWWRWAANVTAGRSSRMKSTDLYSLLTFRQMLQNWSNSTPYPALCKWIMIQRKSNPRFS